MNKFNINTLVGYFNRFMKSRTPIQYLVIEVVMAVFIFIALGFLLFV